MIDTVSRLKRLLKQDPARMRLLKLVAALNLPDAWVAAGFVRNMVWDDLHDMSSQLLNDVDVIFFAPMDVENRFAQVATLKLRAWEPNVNWQVKNQVFMHIRNKDLPYKSCADAMTYWPEKETAVAVCVGVDGQLMVNAPFGLGSLFMGHVSHNPKRDKRVYLQRIADKNWLSIWPKLRLKSE